MDFESNYKQMEYCFRRVLVDQQYLLKILTEDEIKGKPQIMRISEDLRFFLNALENKTGKIFEFSDKFYKLSNNFFNISQKNLQILNHWFVKKDLMRMLL